MANVQQLSSVTLLDGLEAASSERALLVESDAPNEELRKVQHRIDAFKEEILRRMSW